MLLTKLITFPIASLILAGGPGDCYAPKPLLGFKATVSKTKYNISESAFHLTDAHGPAAGGVTLGLAYSPLYYEYENQYEITQQYDYVCVALDKMKLSYRARPMVMISKEFPRGSCEFNAVVEHENKHVAVLRRMHKKYAKEFRDHVQDVILMAKPVKIRSPYEIQQAQEKIEKEIKANLDDFLERINDEMAHEQIKVDAPSEYKRVSKMCDEWDSRLRLD